MGAPGKAAAGSWLRLLGVERDAERHGELAQVVKRVSGRPEGLFRSPYAKGQLACADLPAQCCPAPPAAAARLAPAGT